MEFNVPFVAQIWLYQKRIVSQKAVEDMHNENKYNMEQKYPGYLKNFIV